MHKRKNKSRTHKKNRYKGGNGNTPLMTALLQEDMNQVNNLIARGDDVNTSNYDGETALHLAVLQNNIEIVSILIAFHADVNAKDNTGRTPLHYAVKNDNKDIANLLISKGANVNLKDNDNTILNIALENKKLDIAQLLIDNRADVNIPDTYGRTPLHLASLKGYLDIVNKLLEKGADPNIKDKYDKTPLDIALKKGNKDIIKLFNPNIRNNDKLLLNNVEMERIKSISTPGGIFLKDYQRDYPEEYAKKYTPINTPINNKFLVLGHGCDTGEEFRVPFGCSYYTRATCGLPSMVDKFCESFTTDFIKYNIDKNSVGADENHFRQLKPHTHNTKPYSNAYRSNHMYSNTVYSLFSYFPKKRSFDAMINIMNISRSRIKLFVKNNLMNFPFILPSGIVEYRKNMYDFKYNLSMYSLLFDDNNFDNFFDSFDSISENNLLLTLNNELDALLSSKMEDKTFVTKIIEHAYKYSFFPNKDDVISAYSDVSRYLKGLKINMTLKMLEKLINDKFSISQVELFQHFKGTYYNIICRNPCGDTNTEILERRRRISLVGGKRKTKGTRKRRSG